MSTPVIAKNLLDAARYAMKANSSRNAVLHLDASPSTSTITVTCDGKNVRVQQTIPVEVGTTLHTGVVGKQLAAALKGFPARDTVTLAVVEGGLSINNGERTSLVSTGTLSPDMNHGPWRHFRPRPGDMSGAVDADELRAGLARAGATVGHDAKLPLFTGVHVTGRTISLVVETNNRYAVTRADLAWTVTRSDEDTSPWTDILIPFAPLSAIVAPMRGRLALQVRSDPDIFLDQVLAVEDDDGRFAMVHLMGDQYPHLDRMLKPQPCDRIAVLDAARLTDAISQVSARLVKDTPMVFAFSPAGLVVRGLVESAQTGGEQEWYAESVPCDYDGDPAVIGFSPDYLPVILTTVAGPTVTLRWTQPAIRVDHDGRYIPGIPVNVVDGGDDTTARLVMSWGLSEDKWTAPGDEPDTAHDTASTTAMDPLKGTES